MYIHRCGPTHNEQAASEEERSDHHGHQTGFRDDLVVVGDQARTIVRLAPKIDGCCKCDTYYDGEEGG